MTDDLDTGSTPDGDSTGPSRLVKVLGILLIAAVVIFVLFTQVFPRVEGYLEDPTLGAPTASQAAFSVG